ncbi:MAG: hypothetical protein ACYCOU_04560 [Sulfobacillus sp.]
MEIGVSCAAVICSSFLFPLASGFSVAIVKTNNHFRRLNRRAVSVIVYSGAMGFDREILHCVVVGGVVILVAFYVLTMFPQYKKSVLKIFGNPVVKIGVQLFILFLATRSFRLAMTIGITFGLVMTIVAQPEKKTEGNDTVVVQ